MTDEGELIRHLPDVIAGYGIPDVSYLHGVEVFLEHDLPSDAAGFPVFILDRQKLHLSPVLSQTFPFRLYRYRHCPAVIQRDQQIRRHSLLTVSGWTESELSGYGVRCGQVDGVLLPDIRDRIIPADLQIGPELSLGEKLHHAAMFPVRE